jgi:hypothetical protein
LLAIEFQAKSLLLVKKPTMQGKTHENIKNKAIKDGVIAWLIDQIIFFEKNVYPRMVM